MKNVIIQNGKKLTEDIFKGIRTQLTGVIAGFVVAITIATVAGMGDNFKKLISLSGTVDALTVEVSISMQGFQEEMKKLKEIEEKHHEETLAAIKETNKTLETLLIKLATP